MIMKVDRVKRNREILIWSRDHSQNGNMFPLNWEIACIEDLRGFTG